ncbi:MAG TPA: hypothetical protein VEY71_13095, partial [Chitinophagales bacterium]|nr:hypothetical protein [Chitinophagales bacterium]
TALLLVSLVCFFLALLSKENGLTFVAIVPMTLYVFARLDFKNALVKSLPYVGVAALYFMLRVAVIGFMQKSGGIQEIMNAPYLYATASQALATKLLVLGMYIKLLFWPHPLSYDYSYNQIPYVDFSNGWVWLAVLVQAGLLGVAFWKIRERSVLAYGILFYFFSIFIVSNLVIDIGGTLGERFLYQASFGAALSVVAAAMLAFDKLAVTEQKRFAASAAVLFIVCLPAAVKTVARNPDWKNDKTLFSKDVYVVPNAARARNGAGTAYILLSDDAKSDSLKRAALLDTAVLHLNEALRIHPTYIDPLLNMGVVYNRTGDIEKAEEYWNKARARQEAHPKLKELDGVLASSYLLRGLQKGNEKKYAEALIDIRRSVRYNPNDGDAWYNLGGVYFTLQKHDSAVLSFDRSIALNSKYKDDAANGMQAAISILQQQNKPVPEIKTTSR